jgi:hypothetical protein
MAQDQHHCIRHGIGPKERSGQGGAGASSSAKILQGAIDRVVFCECLKVGVLGKGSIGREFSHSIFESNEMVEFVMNV